ncbi:MAG: hypothetical protein RR959_08820 [Erysipelotrichaceae bacterium]
MKEMKMRFEVSYQCEYAQNDFNEANPETVYCFGEKILKQLQIIAEARKYGSGVLFVVNGNDVLEHICF